MNDSFAAPWKNVASRWEQYYFPAGRPSKEDCQHYAAFIRKALKGKRGTALVLGATPEIRNTLHTFPIEVTSIDINLEMILAMNQFVQGWENDVLVRASWVENPLRSDYYDIVFGDLAWSNIPMNLWPQLNRTLVRVLKKGGHYVHRVQIIPDGYNPVPVHEILTRYSKLPLSTPHPHHFELMFELQAATYDAKKREISMGRVWTAVKPYWKPGTKEAAFPNIGRMLSHLYAFWGPNDKKWNIGTRQQLKHDLQEFFVLEQEMVSRDYHFPESTPIWYCRVKK